MTRSGRRAGTVRAVDDLADLAELFRVALAGGLTVTSAVALVSPRLATPAARAFADAVAGGEHRSPIDALASLPDTLGEHSRDSDLDVNAIKEKKLTNIRAAGKDEAMLLIPPRRMSLEQAIAYIEDDELVEVTPTAVRIRKRYLDPHERKRHERRAAEVDAA